MTDAPRSGESTGDTPNWSVDDSQEQYRGPSPAPSRVPAWDPGPAPGYEVPGYQPLIESRPAAAYPPPLGLQVVPAPPTNGLAVTSLVFGILGWILLPVLAPAMAVIFGHLARGQIRNTGEGGGGMAVAGLVLGYVNLALGLIAVLVLIVIFFIAAAAFQAAAG